MEIHLPRLGSLSKIASGGLSSPTSDDAAVDDDAGVAEPMMVAHTFSRMFAAWLAAGRRRESSGGAPIAIAACSWNQIN